jgi:TRAP-type C4-dicarboxylate transport system substrate-binding protein
MKNKALVTMCLAGLVAFSVAVGPLVMNADAKLVIKAGQVQGGDPTYHMVVAIEYLADRIEKLTDGEVEVRTYHGGLGGERDMMEDTKLGTLDIFTAATAIISGFIPEVGLMNLAYAFKGSTMDEQYENCWQVVRGPFGTWINEKAQAKGFRFIGWWRNGAFSLFTNVPIRNIQDLKGRKIRTLASPELLALYNGYGATAVSIAWNELYTAVQSGVVDGFISTLSGVWANKLNEVIKYHTECYQILLASPIIVSEKRWKSYPEDVKEAVLQAALNSEPVQYETERKQLRETKQKFLDYGIKFFTLSPEEQKPFVDIAKEKVWPKFVKGEENQKWFEFLRKAQDQ